MEITFYQWCTTLWTPLLVVIAGWRFQQCQWELYFGIAMMDGRGTSAGGEKSLERIWDVPHGSESHLCFCLRLTFFYLKAVFRSLWNLIEFLCQKEEVVGYSLSCFKVVSLVIHWIYIWGQWEGNGQEYRLRLKHFSFWLWSFGPHELLSPAHLYGSPSGMLPFPWLKLILKLLPHRSWPLPRSTGKRRATGLV